jgi:hypothetical protein
MEAREGSSLKRDPAQSTAEVPDERKQYDVAGSISF